jgi:phenazine biosynthesis protein phzE
MVPYRQIGERGFAVPDDGAPLLAMTVREQFTLPLADALDQIPDAPVELAGGAFDINDDCYADLVQEVIDREIGRGEGSNFVLKRSFTARLKEYSPATAGTLLRRLLLQETGAYWTFVVHMGRHTFVGASPERHVTLSEGAAVMNPISGTYRYPEAGPDLAGVLDFLSDRKESDELCMVLDEELKMMASVCDRGGRVFGPFLKEMAHLAHTEYLIRGRTGLDVREVLRRTLLAPTVTGSPLESACRAIARYEPQGRGYYSGVAALLGRDAHGRQVLDSAILIRTAQIDQSGGLTLSVGSTIVRHSDPAAEAAETRAKAAGMLRALGAPPSTHPGTAPPVDHSAGKVGWLPTHPQVQEQLARRNDTLAGFWLAGVGPDETLPRLPAGHRLLVIDAEDAFTAMLAHQICELGAGVTVCRFDERLEPGCFDAVVVGPGPGDPRQTSHPKIAILRAVVRRILDEHLPMLALCLGHQVLSGLLGLELVRCSVPRQGLQRQIELFGSTVRVGSYNTFAARSHQAKIYPAGIAAPVDVCRDPATGEVHALRGPGFRSFQFHPESVLSTDGQAILHEALSALLPASATTPDNARSGQAV